jgi:Putative transposase
LIGVLCVLHTWTRALVYHPHVHRLVPAGGVSADRPEWRPARQTSLVPVRALSKLFRGLCRDLVRQARPGLALPESDWTTKWVVYGKPALQGTEQVLRYLGRYVHRIALTDSRMLSIADDQVCFRYQDSRHRGWKPMTLPALEVIRRFLQQVLPEGFHTVRYYGLWNPVHRPPLHQLQLCLAHLDPNPSPESLAPATRPDAPWGVPLRAGQTCPRCGHGLVVFIRSLPPLQGGHHEGPSFLPAYHLDQRRRHMACRLWLPGPDTSVSRKSFSVDPCTTTSLVPIPPQCPSSPFPPLKECGPSAYATAKTLLKRGRLD